MRIGCLVAVVLTCVVATARAERVTLNGVSFETPPGFRLDGARLVADGAIWAFAEPSDASDLDAWMTAAWKAVAASYKDVETVPRTKQTLSNGFVIAIQGAVANDAQGNVHYLMLIGAHRPDVKRIHPSLFDAASDAKYRQLSPLVGKALSSIAAASGGAAPAKQAEPARAALPDGRYGCQTIAWSGANMPAYSASALGTIVVAGAAYDSPSYKGSGKLAVSGNLVRFRGGPFDGYVAMIGATSSTIYIRFNGSDLKATPADSTRMGDHLCYLQKQ